MGLFINLNVNPQHIEPQQWEATYDESLLLLKRFPLPLMRFTSEEVLGQKRRVFTSSIVQGESTADEHWQICGDMISYRYAESFRLYRDLHALTKSKSVWRDGWERNSKPSFGVALTYFLRLNCHLSQSERCRSGNGEYIYWNIPLFGLTWIKLRRKRPRCKISSASAL